MPWTLLSLLSSLMLCAWASEPVPLSSESMVADNALRYVNHDVITLGDVTDRSQMRLIDLHRRGKPLPSQNEAVRFHEQSLDELTDEQLLLQYADQLKVHLDKDRIALNVLDRARRSGLGLRLREQTREREYIVRRETIRAVLSFFDDRTARIAPEDLWAFYQAHRDDFRRPARAHVYQIMLRPTSDAERQALRTDKLATSDDEAKARLLDEVVSIVAGLPSDPLAARGQALVADAKGLVDRGHRVRDADQTAHELEELRTAIAGQGTAAFADAARAHSEGPRADQGGDLGWIERGTYAQAFDQQVFALPAGGLSAVFWSEQVACLVLVAEREEAAQRSFAEVTAEIETQLRQQRTDEVRSRAVAMLRAQASIRDLVPLRSLLLRDGG